MLLSDPVTVEVGGEEHTLEPLDVTKDVPDAWKSLNQAMDLMGTSKADWTNLPILLGAMRRAGRRWKDWQWERIVRTAGDRGMVAEVLQSLRRVEETGLLLGELRVVREVMWACRERAVQGGWRKTETEAALRCAEQVAEMFEHDVHSEHFTKTRDPRIAMDVLGLVLELAAVRAQRHLGGKDADGKVEMYTGRLVPNIKRVFGLELDKGEGLLAARADYELLRWLPLRDGLKLAEQILEESTPGRAKVIQRRDDLIKICSDSAELVESIDEPNKDRRKGLRWFREAEARSL